MDGISVKTAVVVGGGLIYDNQVGSLCSCFLAKEGFLVDLYEKRSDLRQTKHKSGRSINLALSVRGREALRFVGLEELVLSKATYMKGRFLHLLCGETKSVLYDKNSNQCIFSVSRNYLNQILLTASEDTKNVNLHFDYKLIYANLEEGVLTLQNTKTDEHISVTADIIIGADGAHSLLRKTMQQLPFFQLNQSYIDHGYIELIIPSERGIKMTPNHLHIWPRGTFMMIALPNGDDSWNVILFMPFEKFEVLTRREKLLDFFQETFADALGLLGGEELCEAFFKIKPSHLVSIKCSPYHYGKCVIIGDAAHAMVPFYGQGMNAGFEDCVILWELLKKFNCDTNRAVSEFTAVRRDDAHAICDLAMYNYVEMRDSVTKKSFYARKWFDDFLYAYIPSVWVPLYNSVTFSRMRYTECKSNLQWQNQVIQTTIFSVTVACTAVMGLLLWSMV